MKNSYSKTPRYVKENFKDVFPESLPFFLSRLPKVFKGKVAEATEMILAAKCDYKGILACEMAALLLEEEITSENTVYAKSDLELIKSFISLFDSWSMKYETSMISDRVVKRKLEFIDCLLSGHNEPVKNKYLDLCLKRAAYCACKLADIIREYIPEINNDYVAPKAGRME